MAGYPCGRWFDGPCVTPANLPYFGLSNNALRGQLSKTASNAAGFIEGHTEQSFEDVGAGSTFYIYVQRLAARNAMGGYAGGSTNPRSGQGEPCQAGNRPYFRSGNTVFSDCWPPER